MNKHPFITIIGNIGSGKSTVSRLLAERMNAQLVQADEFYKVNPFFPETVVNRSRWSLASDIWFLMKRVEMAKDIETVLPSRAVVQDSGLPMSWVYANSRLDSGHMNRNEAELYNMLYTSLTANTPTEDILVYLNMPVPVLQERIKLRNRDFELKYHSPTYLDELAKSLGQQVERMKRSGISVLEYRQTTDLSQLIEILYKDISNRIHHG